MTEIDAISSHGARLVLCERVAGAEMTHFADETMRITSRHNVVTIEEAGARTVLRLPEPLHRKIAGQLRIVRRALRLDKMNVARTGKHGRQLVILRSGQAFHYDLASGKLTKTLEFKHCRNVLHGAVTVLDGDEVVFGEYGPSGASNAVPIYRSTDAGRSWRVAYEFAPGSVRHVHGCYWDPYEELYWIFTGDSDEESKVLTADRNFEKVELVGTGGQIWRACSVIFRPEHIYWIMDSERATSSLVRLDRESRTIARGRDFPGPVWYTKQTSDGFFLAQTTCELGDGVKDQFGHLFRSTNLEDWEEIGRFAWDGLPKGWFKFGVIAFAEGEQSSESFYLSGEALKGIDGRSYRCRIEAA